MYRVIIISDSDGLLLPVGLVIVLTYLTNLTAQRTPELPRKVTNCSSRVKHGLFISIGFSTHLLSVRHIWRNASREVLSSVREIFI
jgi:hypothetical protein